MHRCAAKQKKPLCNPTLPHRTFCAQVRNFIRRVISKHEDEVQRLVDQVFADHKVNGEGHIERSHVLSFVSSNFKMEAVKVPGQNLERGEITAVTSRLKSRQSSNLSAQSEGTTVSDGTGGGEAQAGQKPPVEAAADAS